MPPTAAGVKKKGSSVTKPRSSTSSMASASEGKAPAKATPAKSKAAAASPSQDSADLIDGHVSKAQCKKAFDALIAHNKKHNREKKEAGEKMDLLADGDEEDQGSADEEGVEGDSSNKRENAWLQITMKQIHDKKQVKPQQV